MIDGGGMARTSVTLARARLLTLGNMLAGWHGLAREGERIDATLWLKARGGLILGGVIGGRER